MKASILFFAALATAASINTEPFCLTPCLQNSQIVTECDRADTACLCADESYQHALHSCITSQCLISEIPSALGGAEKMCATLSFQQPTKTHKKRSHKKNGHHHEKKALKSIFTGLPKKPSFFKGRRAEQKKRSQELGGLDLEYNGLDLEKRSAWEKRALKIGLKPKFTGLPFPHKKA